MNERVTLALDNCDGVHDSNPKSFVDGISQLSSTLFVTAMNEDVEKPREQNNQSTLVASVNNKAIHY